MVLEKKKVSYTNRSRMDIIAEILHVSRGGARKTHIMYRCNLSFRQLKAYLDFLANRGLIEISKSESPTFETTDKGLEFLQTYNVLKVLLSEYPYYVSNFRKKPIAA